MTRNGKTPRIEERLGRAWGVVYVGIILLLASVLFGKACFFSG